MTDPYTGATITDDIDDSLSPSTKLDHEADAFLRQDEPRAFEAPPVRQAIKEDAARARAWGKARAGSLRHAVEEEPIRYSLYALGIGVLIGLLAAR